VGSTYVEIRKMGRRQMEGPCVITTHNPPYQMSFQRTNGVIRPLGHYLMESANQGTKFTFKLDIPLSGIAVLLSPLVLVLLQLVRRGASGELKRLKQLLETSA
jgi:hypothetical protein